MRMPRAVGATDIASRIVAPILAAALVAAVGLGAGAAPASDAGFRVLPAARLAAGLPADERLRAPPGGVVHSAAALVRVADGKLSAFWYEGSAEAASDVAILTATYDAEGWTPAKVLTSADRIGAEQRRHVRFAGNTAALGRPDGEEWLFVSTGLGGWSTGQINLLRSVDGGWQPARVLQATPLLNLGMLVKGAPLPLADGTVALPVYSELSASSYLLFVNRAGEVTGRAFMGRTPEATQPWVVALDSRRAVAFLRDAGRRTRQVWRTATEDGGRSWSPPAATGIPNPDSPVAVVALDDGRLLLVGNNGLEDPATLEAMVSGDEGRTWSRASRILDGSATARTYRYPWLTIDADGRLHLLVTEYFITEGRRAIRHLVLGAEVLGEAPK